MNHTLKLLTLAPAVLQVRTAEEAERAAARGCEAVEVDVSAGVAELRETVARLGRELTVGAGGVLSSERAFEAVDAGAKFIATPAPDPAVFRTCAPLDVPVIGEALTPTELRAMAALGAQMVRLFPGCAVDARYLAALLPLSAVPLAVACATAEEGVPLREAGAAALFLPA